MSATGVPCPAARHDPAGNPTRRSAPGSWVYFPSFFQTDTNTSSADDEAAATLLQVAWRLHKAYAAVHAADAAVNAAATKLQRAARRHLQGRSSGYWALPLTTIVLERVSPSRMSWKKEKEKKPQAATRRLHAAKVAISLASLAVLSSALVVASQDPPKTTAAALRQQKQPSSTVYAKLLPGGLPGGAAGLLSSGGQSLLSLGGSLMSTGGGGSNGSAAVATTAPARSETTSVLGHELPAWAMKTASHGGSVLADKTTPLNFVGGILLEDVKQATAALMRATATIVEHVRAILKATLRRAKALGLCTLNLVFCAGFC
jgi:hypothetical protein